jgi:hypothetical protein
MPFQFSFYILVVIIMFGLLTNYLVMISHIRRLRNDGEGFKKGEILATTIFFGGPILLLYNIYQDVRDDDPKHLYLIFGIVYTLLQALLVFLLIYFNVVIF